MCLATRGESHSQPFFDPGLVCCAFSLPATDGRPRPLVVSLTGVRTPVRRFVPGVQAENMYGKTYGHASHMAIAGDHQRFQWCDQVRNEIASRTKQSAGHLGWDGQGLF